MIIVVRLCAISFAFGVWFILTYKQVGIDRLILPSPGDLIEVLRNNYATLIGYSFTTLFRVLVGYTLGAILGIATGLLMLYNRILGAVFDTYIEFIRPVPPIALTPFFIFWFGIGSTGQIVLIAMVSFLVFAVTLFESGSHFELKYLRAARLLGASRYDILIRIIFPGSMGNLASAARVAAAGAISVSIAAEYLGAQGGLGYFIRNARVTLQTDAILVAVIMLSLISIFLDRLIRAWFNSVTSWMPKDVDRAEPTF